MPFAGYKDFKDCTAKNSDKKNPDAYCATIQRAVEDKANEILEEIKNERDEIQTLKENLKSHSKKLSENV